MVCAAIISISVAVVVIGVAYMLESARSHARREEHEKEIAAAKEELQNALDSHNLARIAAARCALRRLRQ